MKKNQFIFALIITSFVSLFLGNCTNEYVQDINTVCFERDVLPIFVSNCTQSGCHNSVSKEKGYDLTNYAGIVRKGIEPGNYKKSEIYDVLVIPFGEEAMPPKPYNRLTDAQITTIATWIEEGAKNTTCVTVACDTVGVSFATEVFPILQNYCNGCHGGSSPSGNINLTTYTAVKPYVTDGSLYGSVAHSQGFSPMPENGNKLSNCNIALIKSWIDAGAKNN